MLDFIKLKIREIIYNEYNHIIIDSEEYLEFEDSIIKKLFNNNYLEEGFNINIIIDSIKSNLKNY